MIVSGGAPAVPASVAQHYNALDRHYREIWGEHVHHGLWVRGSETPKEAVEALVHRVAKVAALHAEERVLDVGCGYGGTARLLSEAYGVSVEGITLSARQHEYAVAKAAESPGANVRYHLGDWLESNFPPASFDVVLAVESMTHMPSLKGAIERAYKVLRPGGRFVACVWLAAEDAGPLSQKYLLQPICREGGLTGLPTASALTAVATEVGFITAAPAEDLSRKVRHTWTVTIQRGLQRLITDKELRAFMFDDQQSERVFAATMFRIWLAMHAGSMRYGLFSFRKPQ